jgi:tetratricopeptide (TPR) repeat protein
MKKNRSKTNRPKKDRTRNDKGILLEQIVAMLHQDEGVKVETNVKLIPKSGDETRKREIDVLLTRDVAGYPVRVGIQCKNYGKPITVGQIGEFRDLLEDVNIPIQQGIIVSVHGYQSGAEKRAEELGIKTFVLEGLDKTRLKKEIQDTFQYFVHLMVVVEEMTIFSDISDIQAWGFWDDEQKFCGFLSDLIVSRWRNGEIPMKLGEYSFDLKLPKGWHQILNGKFVYPYSMSAKIRVVAYLGEMKGQFEEFRLKETATNKIEKFHLQANFDVINNLIKASQEEPIFTEEELEKLKKGVKVSIENRIRLPKIFVNNHLEPFSEKAHNFFMKEIENLTLEEIDKLPTPKIEEVEGDTFAPMQEPAAMGEPVIIEDKNGDLVDVRLLAKQDKFSEIIELFPLLRKFPRKDFAEYLSKAFLLQGEVLLKKSLQEETSIQKVLEERAFNMFDKAVELSSNVMNTYITLGIVFRQNKLYDKSIQCFETVISSQPQNPIGRGNLAETLFKMGNPTQALKVINKIIEEIPEFPLTIPLLRANIFATEGKFKEATSDLIKVWKDDFRIIINFQVWRELVYEVYKNFQVLGIGVILVDVYLYYVLKYAKENALDDSKKYLDVATTLLEDMHKAIAEDGIDDFRIVSFNPVLNRANNLIEEIKSIYPTTIWKTRLDSLR